jgi:hypothetical protein
MTELTAPPSKTPVQLRVVGAAAVSLTAAVPVVALALADRLESWWGALIAPAVWAILLWALYVRLGRGAEVRRLIALVAGCGALWPLLLGAITLYYLGSMHRSLFMLVGVVFTATLTGATFGLLCYMRYGAIPQRIERAVRLALWAAIPSAVLLVVRVALLRVDGTHLSGSEITKAVVIVVVGPIVLAILLAALSAAIATRPIAPPPAA